MTAIAEPVRPTERVSRLDEQAEASIKEALEDFRRHGDDILQQAEQFRAALTLATKAGLTAREIALHERVAKSTVSRWLDGTSTPQLLKSRAHIARSVLSHALDTLHSVETKSIAEAAPAKKRNRKSSLSSEGRGEPPAARMRA